MADPRYSWSTDEERYYGDFATVEEALEEADQEGREEGDAVFVGEQRLPDQPEDFWRADDWLEHVSEQDDYCAEVSEDWEQSTKEQRSELESEVRKVLAAWLDKHSLRPKFWLITDARKYVKEGGKWAESPSRK